MDIIDLFLLLVSKQGIMAVSINIVCSFLQCAAQDATGIFWDNDSLAALLALEIEADLLILLSDVEGLYTGPPSEPKSQLIHTYLKEKHDDMVTFGAKSRVGRGGMTAKVYAAWQAASAGIPVIISRSVCFLNPPLLLVIIFILVVNFGAHD